MNIQLATMAYKMAQENRREIDKMQALLEKMNEVFEKGELPDPETWNRLREDVSGIGDDLKSLSEKAASTEIQLARVTGRTEVEKTEVVVGDQTNIEKSDISGNVAIGGGVSNARGGGSGGKLAYVVIAIGAGAIIVGILAITGNLESALEILSGYLGVDSPAESPS